MHPWQPMYTITSTLVLWYDPAARVKWDKINGVSSIMVVYVGRAWDNYSERVTVSLKVGWLDSLSL